MNTTTNHNLMPKARLDEIKVLLKLGEISYDEAKVMAKEPLAQLNARIEAISKEYGRKPKKVSFVGFMR